MISQMFSENWNRSSSRTIWSCTCIPVPVISQT